MPLYVASIAQHVAAWFEKMSISYIYHLVLLIIIILVTEHNNHNPSVVCQLGPRK